MKNSISKGTLAQPSGARLCPEGVTCIQEKLQLGPGWTSFSRPHPQIKLNKQEQQQVEGELS